MEKVKVTIWNSDIRRNEIKDAKLLHWGLSYEELRDGVGTYSVVFVMLEDGKVIEVHPSLIQFVIDEKLQKIEASANDLLEALIGARAVLQCMGVKASNPIGGAEMQKIYDAIKKATE